MQTIIQVHCKSITSLRKQIINDVKDLEASNLKVPPQSKKNKWGSLKSKGAHGAIKISWDAATNILSVRIINRKGGKPHTIVGDFISYLLKNYTKSINSINIITGNI